MGETTRVLKDEALDKEFELILSKQELEGSILHYLQESAGRTKIAGFRPGKVPLSVLYQNHGQEALDKAIQHAVSRRAGELVGEGQLAAPLSYQVQDSLENVTLETLKDVHVHVYAAFKPHTPEIQWETITLQSYDVVPTEEEVTKVLEGQASQVMTSAALEEKRPAEKGDTLLYVMQYVGSDGNRKEVEGAFQLGSGMLPEEFEKSLEGISEGHRFEERLRVPKNFPERSLAGKKVSFNILFTEIRKTVPHQVNEDFAISQGAKDLAEYRERTIQALKQQALLSLEAFHHHQLVEKIKAQAIFDVPTSMVEAEFQTLWATSAVGKETDAEKKKELLDQRGQSEEDYQTELRQKAKANVCLGFILKDIIQAQELSVEEKELGAYMHTLAHRTQTSVENIVNFLRRHPRQAEAVVDEILERKALEWACSQCVIETQEVSLEGLKTQLEKELS